MKRCHYFLVMLSLGINGQWVWAEEPPENKPVVESIATTLPAEPAQTGETPLGATVVEVVGKVVTAPLGVSVDETDRWQPVVADAKLAPGTQIRTGFRASLSLLFGDNTLIHIKQLSLGSIDSFYKTETEQIVDLGLGYGAIRGGVAEGGLRSNVQIHSTVATLSKRGTEGFQMWVEAATGRFRISLDVSGLVEALEKTTGRRSLIAPGQSATNLTVGIAWIKQALFDHTVSLYPLESVTLADLAFAVDHQGGLSVVGPEGRGIFSITGRDAASFILQQIAQQQSLLQTLPDMLVLQPQFISRPEGNFGVGATFQLLSTNRTALDSLSGQRSAGLRLELSALQSWLARK